MEMVAQKKVNAYWRDLGRAACTHDKTHHATRGTDVSSPALPMRIASNPLERTATLRPGSTFARSAPHRVAAAQVSSALRTRDFARRAASLNSQSVRCHFAVHRLRLR
jgi:hypothetical protein